MLMWIVFLLESDYEKQYFSNLFDREAFFFFLFFCVFWTIIARKQNSVRLYSYWTDTGFYFIFSNVIWAHLVNYLNLRLSGGWKYGLHHSLSINLNPDAEVFVFVFVFMFEG